VSDTPGDVDGATEGRERAGTVGRLFGDVEIAYGGGKRTGYVLERHYRGFSVGVSMAYLPSPRSLISALCPGLDVVQRLSTSYALLLPCMSTCWTFWEVLNAEPSAIPEVVEFLLFGLVTAGQPVPALIFCAIGTFCS